MKFSDLTNDEIKSGKPSPKKKDDASEADARLSFRKLAAEHKKELPTDEAVYEKVVSDKEQIAENGPALYQKAAAYLKQVFEAVKRRKMFSLDPGLRIIREMVEIQSFQDSLFIEALHFDAPLQFIINNNVNVAIYAIKMAENLGFSKDRKIEIGMAGLMHDVGMALIPEKLIYKQERLSEAEFRIFKERQNYSYKILQSFGEDYAYLAECAVQVNERLDGSGYPQGLQGDEINEYAQIIGLVDMYEALIHSRPQREKFLHFSAVKEIIKSGKNLFQRKHLKALLNIFSIFPLHSYVRLNSNAVGKVIETYPDLPMRPRVQIVFDSQQRQVLTERIVNLPDDPLLYIVDSASDEDLQQLSEGSDSEPRVSADREKKQHDDTDTAEVKTAAIDDELPAGIQEEEDQTDLTQKTGWFKLALIIGAIALLVTGLVLQFANKDSKPLDADKLQTSVMKQEPGGAPLKGSADISLPPVKKSHVREDVAQEKPADYQKPKAIVEETAPSSSVNGAVVSEESVSDKEQAAASAALPPTIEPLEESDKYDLKTEPTKQLYPYSIKLDAFRSREEAEKFIAVYREKGFTPYWVKVDLRDHGVWYRVFTGYFEDVEQAQNIIKTQGLTKAKVNKTKYATLIGTYRSEADANSQVQLLSKQGFSPYVVKGTNGEFYLYVGGFYTRKGAEDQYSDLLAAGIQGQIVERYGTQKIETPKESEPDVKAVKKSYPYSIKLTYFRSREKAEKVLTVYREQGLSPYWVKVKLGDQGIWYRVFAGYFEDIAQAEEIIKALYLKGALVKKTRFASLIGSYQSERDLNSRIQQILKQGFSPYVVKGANGEFYLYVGAFYTRKGAKDQYNDLLAAGIKNKVVER